MISCQAKRVTVIIILYSPNNLGGEAQALFDPLLMHVDYSSESLLTLLQCYLMSIVDVIIRHPRQHLHILLVLHINNGQSVLVVAEADLSSLIVGIWTLVDHTLCIVDIAVLSKAAGKLGNVRITNVDNVKSTGAGTTAH